MGKRKRVEVVNLLSSSEDEGRPSKKSSLPARPHPGTPLLQRKGYLQNKDIIVGSGAPTELENTRAGSSVLQPRILRTSPSPKALPSIEYDSDSDTSSTGPISRKRRRRELSHVKTNGPAYPRSAYAGWSPPLPVVSEREALAQLDHELKNCVASNEQPDYKYVVVDDFSIYHPPNTKRASELSTLDKLQVMSTGCTELLFDGTLQVGESTRFVQGVPFKVKTVEGYGDQDVVSLHGRICVKSVRAATRDIWYQLGRPSKEYKRFYDPFLWLAEFTKHFVDYLLEVEDVSLDDFRFCFRDWLVARHMGDFHLRRWLDRCKLRDFRTTVVAHIPYLWHECHSLASQDPELLRHPVWGESDPYNLTAIPMQKNREARTVVTPFVYGMFKDMYFGDFLRKRDAGNEDVATAIARKKRTLGLTPAAPTAVSADTETGLLTPKSARPESALDTNAVVHQGDVVCVDADQTSLWRSSSTTWYAYVQAVRDDKRKGHNVLDVIWLYEPGDTTLGKSCYPFPNELFMSDNCDNGQHAIHIDCARAKVDVSWYAKDPYSETGFFVRQKFRTKHNEDTYDFVSLQPSDFLPEKRRSAFEECREKYGIGDTVLVRVRHRLEPAQIVDFNLQAEQVVLRHFERKSETDRHARPNELVLTGTIYRKGARQVIRRCHVRTFDAEIIRDGLPTGYDRGGAGDFYFIASTGASDSSSDRDDSLPVLEQGLDLGAPPDFEKLTGMGIFCGGGSFDRGLEESGIVDFKYAVDWAPRALHTYRANAPVPENVQCFFGSVNDYLAQTLAGSDKSCVARPGSIGILTAGSPCPGFSNLQPDKQSQGSLQNASMVASVVSFVDVYSPEYCILENVVSMTSGLGKNKDENVFAQILAAFVAIGYQVQQFLMKSWSYGSSQSRSRVFIIASAPGLAPLPVPPHSHDHPAHCGARARALGRSSNGLPFGIRRDHYTPFANISAEQATADLPDIGDGQCRICPTFPDHRPPAEEPAINRERMAAVPVRPPGLGLAQVEQRGALVGEPLTYISKVLEARQDAAVRTYTRVHPHRLIATVTTALRVRCAFSGNVLHYQQDRTLSVMELRRAQGFLDYEVIVGSPHQQVQIIGNSVDRKVPFALGLCLRESWSRSEASQYSRVMERSTAGLATPAGTEESEERTHVPKDHRAGNRHGFSIGNAALPENEQSGAGSGGLLYEPPVPSGRGSSPIVLIDRARAGFERVA